MESMEDESQPAEARSRLLDTARRAFYADGIRSVGIGRIVADAQVTRATLYRHFPGREDLVLAYLGEIDRKIRGQVREAASDERPAAAVLRALSESIARDIRSPGFRGCAFLNAVAEYPETDHPVHQAVLAHRRWFLETVTALLTEVRGEPADAPARHFVMLRDGAMATGCLIDPAVAGETFLRGVNGLLDAQLAEHTEPPAA